jgi:hypothetical protein
VAFLSAGVNEISQSHGQALYAVPLYASAVVTIKLRPPEPFAALAFHVMVTLLLLTTCQEHMRTMMPGYVTDLTSIMSLRSSLRTLRQKP